LTLKVKDMIMDWTLKARDGISDLNFVLKDNGGRKPRKTSLSKEL